ncbi:MAG: GerAB/ArcD/ProY family transporter [Oscillospiraceae bacterium]|jgi:spore germination protein KB
MQTQEMSSRQAICLMVLFLTGNSALFGINQWGGRDSWLTLLLAGAFSLLIVALYARILRLGQKNSFFETLASLFGKGGGGVVTLLFVLYYLFLSALLMRTLSEFGRVNSLQNPPYQLIMILFTLAGIFLSRGGEAIMGRWALIVFTVFLGVAIFILATSIQEMKLLNLFPMLRRSPSHLLYSTAWYLSFPFLECVVFLPLLSRRQNPNELSHIFRYGILWSGVILLAMLLCNLLLLGEPMLRLLYFQSHSAVKLLHVGDFLSRMEEIISIVLLLSGLTKFTVCLRAAVEGISFLLARAEPQALTAPVGIFSFALSMVVVSNIMDMEHLLNLSPCYSWVFQLALPALIWGMLEYKTHKKATLEEDSSHLPPGPPQS